MTGMEDTPTTSIPEDAPAAGGASGTDGKGADARGAPSGGRDLSFVLDIPLEVSVELGRTRMTIEELIALSSTSVVELDRFAGEPVDVLVNRKLVARGECVVVHDKFGVRLTEIVSPRDRLERLR